MNKRALVRGTQSFLSFQLRDAIKNSVPGVEISAYGYSINELSNMDEHTRAMVVFVDGETAFNQSSLTYIKDLSVEKEIPILFCLFEDEKSIIEELMKGANVAKVFYHPLNLKEIVECTEYLIRQGNEEKKKILVVDDDGMYCMYIKKILERKYIVLYETSGLSAVAKMSQIKPDLVLLDYEMPKLDGFTLYDCIKDEDDLSSIPIAFLTSKNDVETVQKAATLGPEGYFLKSMSPDDLLKGIDNFFARKKAQAMINPKESNGKGLSESLAEFMGMKSVF